MKSFEVLAKITTPVDNYTSDNYNSQIRFDLEETIEGLPVWAKTEPPLTSSTHSDDVMKCEVIKEKKYLLRTGYYGCFQKETCIQRSGSVWSPCSYLFSTSSTLDGFGKGY